MPFPMERTSIRKLRLFQQSVALESETRYQGYRKGEYNIWGKLIDITLSSRILNS